MIKLTIAIPTYNRAQYLLESLESIVHQLTEEVEIIISDNNSIDNTEEVVQHYIKNYNIRYYKNEKNYGFDYNILNCMNKAQGQYIHLMSDDDLMLKNSIYEIIKYIEKYNPDYIHLNSISFWNTMKNSSDFPRINIEEDIITENKNKCIQTLGVLITFLSSTVIKKDNLRRINDPSKYIGSYFLHSHILFETLNRDSKIIITKKPYIGARMNNSGGFNLYEVWIKQYKRLLLGTAVKAGFSKVIMKKIYVEDIKGFITDSILKYSIEKNIYDMSQVTILLKNTFMYPSIWLRTYSIVLMPICIKKKLYYFKKNKS